MGSPEWGRKRGSAKVDTLEASDGREGLAPFLLERRDEVGQVPENPGVGVGLGRLGRRGLYGLESALGLREGFSVAGQGAEIGWALIHHWVDMLQRD